MTAIDVFVSDLGARLRFGGRARRSVLDEVRDHLNDSADRSEAAGSTRERAEATAVVVFGSAELLARHFNAAAGARAMRRAPLVALAAGASVVVGFVVAAAPQPRTARPATPTQQVTFFLAVVALQVAITAGFCGGARVLAVWRSAAASGPARAFVRRCILVSMVALVAGVASLALNFVLDARRSSLAHRGALAIGAAVMIVGAAAGLVTARRLRVNASDEDDGVRGAESPPLLRAGDTTITLVHHHPVVACGAVMLAASAWAMSRAEAASVIAALPWGAGEAAAVVLGFVVLGPLLGLRPRWCTADGASEA
jgi:hypothetical protein